MLFSLFSLRKTLLCLLFLTYYFVLWAHNKSNCEKTGDIVQLSLPFAAASGAFYLEDYQGFQQFSYAFAASMVTTYSLKYSINRRRPDGTNYSFPSGHTACAFSGASFIQMRYGWKLGLPAYLLASFVGYTRVRAERHHRTDVYAAAALATGFSYLFTSSYTKQKTKKIAIAPLIEQNCWGVQMAYGF